VQGEASDATGQLAFAKPDGGRYMISTRTEEQIVQSSQRFARVGSRVSTVAGIVGGCSSSRGC
jgi:E3 Ubiquitin ligase